MASAPPATASAAAFRATLASAAPRVKLSNVPSAPPVPVSSTEPPKTAAVPRETPAPPVRQDSPPAPAPAPVPVSAPVTLPVTTSTAAGDTGGDPGYAGFIFLASNVTYAECLGRSLFGLPQRRWDGEVSAIRTLAPDRPDWRPTLLFLLNTSRPQSLLGVWVAIATGVDLVPEAWGGRFNAQATVSRVIECPPYLLTREFVAGHKSTRETANLLSLLGLTTADVAAALQSPGTYVGRPVSVARPVWTAPTAPAAVALASDDPQSPHGSGCTTAAADALDIASSAARAPRSGMDAAYIRGTPAIDQGPAAGYVFHCDSSTYLQCMEAQRFGATARHLEEMKATIEVGRTALFFVNVVTRTMRGVYYATAQPFLNAPASGRSDTRRRPRMYATRTLSDFPAQVPFAEDEAAPARRDVAIPVAFAHKLRVGPLGVDHVDVLKRVLAGTFTPGDEIGVFVHEFSQAAPAVASAFSAPPGGGDSSAAGEQVRDAPTQTASTLEAASTPAVTVGDVESALAKVTLVEDGGSTGPATPQ